MQIRSDKFMPSRGSKSPSKAPKPPKARKSISKLKKELDAVFSKFIRNRDKGQCYTCPHKAEPKRMQNGHFIPRQYTATRYDEKNNHCQCYACNMLFNGQPGKYALNLIRDYGPGIIEELEGKRFTVIKDFPYEEKIAYYGEKLKEFS